MSPAKTKRYDIIHSLDKGLHLLEVIQQADRPASLQQLWQQLKWDKATIYRLLTTLEKRGYIHRNPETREYSLGIKIYGLYDSLIRQLDLQQISRPYLARLVRETGHSAHLAVSAGKCIVFIDRLLGSETLSVNTQIGAIEPLHCTALGKAYLAYVDPDELDTLLETPLTRFTPTTIVERDAIETELAAVRENGFAVDDEEYSSGIRCVAGAILNQEHVPVALIGVSGPKNRITDRCMQDFGQLVRSTSLEISLKFGYGIGMNDEGVETENDHRSVSAADPSLHP